MTRSENIETIEMVEKLVRDTQTPKEFVKRSNKKIKDLIAFTISKKQHDGRVSLKAYKWALKQDISNLLYSVESVHVCHINSIAEIYAD